MRPIETQKVTGTGGLVRWWSRLKGQYKATTLRQKLIIHTFDVVYVLGFILSIVAVARFAAAPGLSSSQIFVLVGGVMGFMLSVLSVFLDCWWWMIFISENPAERKVGKHKWLLGYTIFFLLANLFFPIVAVAVSYSA